MVGFIRTRSKPRERKNGQILTDGDNKFRSPVFTQTTMFSRQFCWRKKFLLSERILLVCLFSIVTLLPLSESTSGDTVLPDLSKIPTPPSFIHEPNQLVIYFDVESSGGSGSVNIGNGSASQNGGNLKERKFHCRATGYPAVNYRWQKNGHPFNLTDDQLSQRITRIPGEGSFLFGELTNADEGTYQCVAENGNGTAYDRPIDFKRTLINLFAGTRTETYQVMYGDPFSKQCIPPHSVPPPITYWILMSGPNAQTSFKTINFTNVAVNDKGTIFFQYVTEADNYSGFYFTCIAENVALKDYKFGNQFNFDLVKTPSRPRLEPSIAPIEQYTSPSRLTVVKNRSLELFCIFSGYPDFIPTWSKRNGKLDLSRISYGTNFQKSIKIDRVTEDDAGVYECIVEKSSHLNKTFTVLVESAPFWRDGKKPRNLNSSEGSEVEFHCDVAGNPTPTVTFFKNGEAIIVDDRISINNGRLVIKDLRKGDDGFSDNAVYHCKAENKHGFVWANFYLNILAFAPIVIEDAGVVETVVGKNATLKCKVFGSPKPTASWTSSNPRMHGEKSVHYDVIDVDYDGYTELRLKNLKKEDEGDYECSFKNQYGSASCSGKILVRAPTVIVNAPKNQTVTVTAGTRLELKCQAKHDDLLKLKYSWFIHDMAVKNETQISVDPDNLSSTLTIDSPTGDNTGVYKCLAQTELDSTERTMHVVVKDVPLAPHKVFVNCFANTAEVSFYYNDRHNAIAPATHWVIQLNADPNEPDAWDTYVANLSNVKSSQQTTFSNVTMDFGKGKANVHLYPFGDFAFRVVAINEVGHSPPAYPVSFQNDQGRGRCQTAAAPPERNPVNVEVRGKTPDNLEVSWMPMPRRDWYGPGFKYLLQYRGKNDEEYKNFTVEEPYQSSAVIPEVQPYTEHEVLVWAVNQEGLPRVRPAVHGGISGESLPTDAPTGFKLKSRDGPSSATFHWIPVDPNSLNGEFKGYKVEHWYSTNKRSKSQVKEAYFDSQAREGTIYDMKPNRENFARIMVYNNAGSGPASGIISFQMPEGVPTAVQDLSAFPVSHSEIGVTWKAPREYNGNLTGYEVTVCSKSDSSSDRICVRSEVKPDSLTEKRIEDLKPSTRYGVEVVALTSAGAGDPNWAETNTTEKITAFVPPATPSIEDVQIGKENLNVTFKPGHEKEKPSGGHFFVQYRPKGSAESEWVRVNETVGSFTVPLKSLKSGTNYEIRVVADHNGLKTNSPSQYHTTAGGSAYSSTAGWLIAIIVAIIILIIILIIVCLVVRNRGAKYAVSEKEKEQGREPMLKEEKGFGEYARPEIEEEKRSLTAESKKSESETDSMAEYGEGENGRFTEDGSFIGQYGREKALAAAEKARLNGSSTVA